MIEGARLRAVFFMACVFISLGGCSTVGYYAQLVDGHLSLLDKRESIDKLIASDHTTEELNKQLKSVQAIRQFAIKELLLPDNGSYKSYADIGRDFVTWNVIATPPYSLDAKNWCFWVAGCVAYKGFFREKSAQVFADSLREQGYDVAVTGATAYSTLGWFDDPVLNTMLNRETFVLAGFLFHELAHQKLYVQDSSDFNEAFATFVQGEGTRRWLLEHGDEDSKFRYEARVHRQADFLELLQRTRGSLAALYEKEHDEKVLRDEKAGVFRNLKSQYRLLKQSWGGYSGYDHWFDRPLNNAHLALLSTYHRWVPGFAQLYRRHGDLAAFYDASKQLGKLPLERRSKKLNALSGF